VDGEGGLADSRHVVDGGDHHCVRIGNPVQDCQFAARPVKAATSAGS
jgi:hypothetical protein